MAMVLCNPVAFSDAVLVVFWIAAVVASLLVDALVWGVTAFTLVTSLIALVPSTGVFLVFRNAQTHITSPALKRWFTALGYFTTLATRGAVIWSIRTIFDQPTSPFFPDMTVSVGVPAIISMGLAAAVEHRRNTHVDLTMKLLSERDELLHLSGKFEEKLAEAQHEMEMEVRRELEPVIEDVRSKISRITSQSDATRAIDSLSAAVSEVVRPMSHRLVNLELSVGRESKQNRSRPVLAVRGTRIDSTKMLDVHLLFTLEIFEALVFGPLLGVISSSIFGDVFTTLIAMALTLAIIKYWPQRFRNLTFVQGIAAWSALFVIGLVLPRTLLHFALPDLFGNPFLAAHLFNRYLLVVGFLVSNTLEQLEDRAEAELRNVNLQLQKTVANLRRELAIHRRNLSWLLHGPIQSALVSSAIKLQKSNLSTADAHKLNEDIAQAVSHIQGGYRRNNNFDEALMQLRGIWSRIVDIEVSVSDDARSRLELDQTLSGSLAQVLVEAVSNAKKHGQASHVSVEIEIDAADNLVCSIYNNGSTISENAQDGLGSTLFDELCLSWQRVNTENGVTLIATF
uniref:Histidine kinase/HSP90-like ATPase domain-containing protein n=2 Tax=uncultured Actinomycetes bacterium TaxID=152507 RepID=A0A871Y7H7_9ACTN|nr:hypothetical protein HULAa32G3_00002 [uncultured Actinomycetes bacterium]